MKELLYLPEQKITVKINSCIYCKQIRLNALSLTKKKIKTFWNILVTIWKRYENGTIPQISDISLTLLKLSVFVKFNEQELLKTWCFSLLLPILMRLLLFQTTCICREKKIFHCRTNTCIKIFIHWIKISTSISPITFNYKVSI